MKQIKASVFILTYNSEADIVAVLESVAGFADIVIVDSGSTDSTLSILRKYPVRIFQQQWLGYAEQKKYALGQCKLDWVFNLDSDEVADPVLVEDIATIVAQDKASAIKVSIREHFLGQQTHAWTKHASKVRIFKRSAAKYENVQVHEGVIVAGEIVESVGYIHHYGEKSIAIKMNKINNYSGLKTAQHSKIKSLFVPIYLLFVFPLAFFKSYILRRQFLNGVPGFMAAMMNAFYAFLKQAKSYERNVLEQNTA